MADTANDLVDDYRTTQRAGESMKNTAKTPSLVLVTVAAVAFVVCLAGFALRHIGVGVDAAIVTLLAVGASLAWLTMDGRRVRQVQREWGGVHHDAVAPH